MITFGGGEGVLHQPRTRYLEVWSNDLLFPEFFEVAQVLGSTEREKLVPTGHCQMCLTYFGFQEEEASNLFR
jgi:hypothetical protein